MSNTLDIIEGAVDVEGHGVFVDLLAATFGDCRMIPAVKGFDPEVREAVVTLLAQARDTLNGYITEIQS